MVLPTPEVPIIAIFSPLWILKLTPINTYSVSYAKCTLSNTIHSLSPPNSMPPCVRSQGNSITLYTRSVTFIARCSNELACATFRIGCTSATIAPINSMNSDAVSTFLINIAYAPNINITAIANANINSANGVPMRLKRSNFNIVRIWASVSSSNLRLSSASAAYAFITFMPPKVSLSARVTFAILFCTRSLSCRNFIPNRCMMKNIGKNIATVYKKSVGDKYIAIPLYTSISMVSRIMGKSPSFIPRLIPSTSLVALAIR